MLLDITLMKENILTAFNLMPGLKRNIDDRFTEELSIVFDIFISWLIFVVAVIFSVISIYLDLRYHGECYLFQRSGALIVIAAAIIEIKLSKYPNWFEEDLLHFEHDAEEAVWDRFFNLSSKFRRIGWYSLVIGTVIWAYGDIPFK